MPLLANRTALFSHEPQERPAEERLLTKATRNSAWIAADKALRISISVIATAIVARTLGPGEFGILIYALTVTAMFAVIGTWGIDKVVVHDLAIATSGRDELLATCLWLRISGALVAFLAALAFLQFSSGTAVARLVAAIVALTIVVQAFDVVDLWFESALNVQPVVIARSAVSVIAACAKIALVVNGGGVTAVAWIVLAESVLSTLLVGLVFLWQTGEWLRPAFDKAIATSLVERGLPLLMSAIAVTVYMKIDVVMLKAMADEAAVGVYGVAVRLSEMWYVIPTIITTSFLPATAKLRESDPESYRRRTIQLYRYITYAGLVIAGATTVLAGPIVQVLFGEGYADAAGVLVIHIWAGVFVFLGVAQGPWLIGARLTHLAILRTATGAVTNVILNLILIPRMGLEGAALATLISYAVGSVFANALHARTRPLLRLQIQAVCFWRPI